MYRALNNPGYCAILIYDSPDQSIIRVSGVKAMQIVPDPIAAMLAIGGFTR